MEFLPSYLLKLSIILITGYIVYITLLRRLTFYTWNRWYLVFLSLLSFIIPLIDISTLIKPEETQSFINYIPSLPNVIESDSLSYTSFNGSVVWMNSIYILVATGALVLFIRLVLQYLSFRRMVRSADVIMEGPVRVYQVHDSIVPFSFANSIFINAAQHDEAELKEIIRHEFIHVKQRHTIDIMVSEMLVMLNWYNPFAWMIRHSIRQNLEFIADEQVIKTGVNKREYQYLLLKVIGAAPFGIANKFNFNSLKKRIAMMNKNKTARVQLLRFAMVLPIVVLALVAFRNDVQVLPSLNPVMIDTVPVKAQVKPENISNIDVRGNIVNITLKDGTRESFDLNDARQKSAFEKKYGKLPAPPPAPTPPPPPPVPSISGNIVTPDDIATINISKEKDGEGKITIVKKDGKVEAYDMSNEKQKADFEKKYGKISISAVEPVPPVPPIAPVAPYDVNATVPGAPVPVAPAAPAAPAAPVAPAKSDDPFFKNNPEIRSVYVDDSNTLFITLKNGKKEQYSLTEGKDKKVVIEKYGSLPSIPAAPKSRVNL